jgi:hypothetical protein
MNLAINAVSREGFEVADVVDGGQVLMKRPIPK